MISIFEFSDYKAYLKALEKERAAFQRGFRSRLSEVLNCQNAYISQILNTHANFSLEQGLKITEFLNLTEIETRYFVLLIEHQRAGTQDLKKFFQRDLETLREKHLDIKDRIPEAKALTAESQSVYYSSWIYSAIHVLITIPQFRTFDKISAALGLPAEVVNDALLFLVSTGLVIRKKQELTPGSTQIHLGKSSPHIRQHHANWRIAAVQSLTSKNETDIHYSTVSSLSFEDADKLKSRLVQVIQEYVEAIKPSKEETLFNFNLDFYSLIK